MTKKIDLFDPSGWSQLNWDEKEIHPDLKKTDKQLDRKRINTLRNNSPAMIKAVIESNQRRQGEAHPFFGIKGEECHNYGRVHGEEHRRKSARHGPQNGMYGVHLTGELNGFFQQNHTEETVEHLRQVALNREQDHHCEHCNGNFTAQAYKQHHGEHCAQNPNRIVKERKLMDKQICPHCGTPAAYKAYARLHGDKCKKKAKT